MNYQLLMDTAMLAGEIMQKSGAETYRIEDTMAHILRTADLKKVETYVTITGIMATLNDDRLPNPITEISRVDSRSINLNRIIQVNAISRNYCDASITLEEAYRQLQTLQAKEYSPLYYNIATILVPLGFAMFFDGSLTDLCGAAISSAVLALVITLCKKQRINGIIQDILSSFGIAASAFYLRQAIFPLMDMDIVIISTLMPLVPGVAITTAIRDLLQGDYLSGSARILEAFLKAASIALGIGIGLAVTAGFY